MEYMQFKNHLKPLMCKTYENKEGSRGKKEAAGWTRYSRQGSLMITLFPQLRCFLFVNGIKNEGSWEQKRCVFFLCYI